VIKIGTSTLTDESGKLDSRFFLELASQVAQLIAEGCEVLVVSSGAIIAGLEAFGLPPSRPGDIPTLQAAAALGQVELSRHYAAAFEPLGIKTAQVLLTRGDIANRESYLYARDTLQRLFEMGAVTVINENDTIAVDEIRFGDNDTLAAQVAILVKADLVILLSDIEGLYTADPRIDEDAQLIREIGAFTEEIVQAAGVAASGKGSGGMVTKLEAARLLMAAGIPMVICEGSRHGVVAEVVSGTNVGTRFEGGHAAHGKARKLWRALSGAVTGSVVVDDGAVKALRDRGGSLLPVGIVRVDGSFERGAVVDIRAQSGFLIGRGIIRYSAEALTSVAGMTSGALSSKDLPGASTKYEAIHRDEMVVF
jgi:glutamate 5-kinase